MFLVDNEIHKEIKDPKILKLQWWSPTPSLTLSLKPRYNTNIHNRKWRKTSNYLEHGGSLKTNTDFIKKTTIIIYRKTCLAVQRIPNYLEDQLDKKIVERE